MSKHSGPEERRDDKTIDTLLSNFGPITDELYHKLAGKAHRPSNLIREDIKNALTWIRSKDYKVRKKGERILGDYGHYRSTYGF